MISIALPIYDKMENGDFFLQRALDSVKSQTFTDYEIVSAKTGMGMAHNINETIKMCKGNIIKILFQDDFLAHENSLQVISDNFKGGWLVTGCEHTEDGITLFRPHYADYNDNIHLENTIGSPSVLAFENKEPLLFDEDLTWMLDCDLYKRLYARYGEPTIVDDLNVVIGIGKQQATEYLNDELKQREVSIMQNRYETA